MTFSERYYQTILRTFQSSYQSIPTHSGSYFYLTLYIFADSTNTEFSRELLPDNTEYFREFTLDYIDIFREVLPNTTLF